MKKVLLVEDDAIMCRMYERIFILEGYDMQIANDGLEGYEKAKTFKPDLILLDIMMPRMNGLQALEKLKQDTETKAYPVIMLTNLANKEDAEHSLQNGAVQCLIKSDFDPKQIVDIVKKFFQQQPQ